VAWLRAAGHAVVLVHGGSADVERLAAWAGVPSRQLVAPDGTSARYTDPAMLEIVVLALAGAAKPRLLAALAKAGARAVGLTGLDDALLRGRRSRAHRAIVDGRRILVRDNHSGRIHTVNIRLLRALLDAGLTPVLSPPALDEDDNPMNVNADRAAAAVAAALGAAWLVLLTGAPGVLADPADEASALAECRLAPDRLPSYAAGGMGLKLVAAREALRGGVPEVLIADGRRPAPVRAALAGAATRVLLSAEALETSP
jgi:acetylglutamate/LysW-gamma-L-alpha-aminoadipate kinase